MKWSELKSLSGVRLFAAPWTIAHQAPLSMGFPRQEKISLLQEIFPTQVSHIVGTRFTIWATREVSRNNQRDY